MFSIRDISRSFFTFTILIVLLICCSKNEVDVCNHEEGSAKLSLVLKVPVIDVDVKSVSSAPSDPSSWTMWEKAVDGRYLYRVTAFLLQDDRLVSSADVMLTGEVSETVLEFDGNFTHGRYRLMAVANYSGHQADDGDNGVQNYEGLPGFTDTVESILEQTTVDDFTSAYADSFINYELTSSGGICARVPQPLTMAKDIELHPGINTVEGELIRTYSRIRIAVENQSDEDLMISSLSFSNVFAQKRAYLFPENGYIDDRTSLDVDEASAITPFTATAEEPLTITGKQTAVIFDAYILESCINSINESYSYTLSLGYDGTRGYKLRSTAAVNRRNSVSDGYYLIYNTTSRCYLTAGVNSVQTGVLPTLTEGMAIPEEYVWTFDNSGLSSYCYYIGTSEAMTSGQTSYYMNNPSTASVGLGSNRSVYFTVGESSSVGQYYLNLRSSGTSRRYLTVSNDNVAGRSSTNNSTRFRLYPVNAPSAASSLFTVPLETIDRTTGQATETSEIRRNDFINAIVLVRYNKNEGHFVFEVKDWESAGGDVEFN